MTRYLVLLSFLGLGACSAFTPSEVKRGVAVAHRDVDAIRRALAAVNSAAAELPFPPILPYPELTARSLRNLDDVAANLSAMDTLLNK